MRNVPPWDDGGASLRVGYDPVRKEYIIRAPGYHIIGATADGEEVLEAIRFEAEWGFGSMELRLQGCALCQGRHGHRAERRPAARVKERPSGKIAITLEDLGL